MIDLAQTFYLHGFARYGLPRWFRRCIARSTLHRAWLLGSLGYFVENGIHYGPARSYRSAAERTRDE